MRKVASLTSLALLALALGATPAFAWGNGGDNGNGYATHDWILEHAITLAGEDADWIDVDVALRATDDPDYGSTKTSKLLHTFMESGTARGGPQQAADEYFKLMTAYKAGNYTEASRLLGVMSHYYADVCTPYHVDSRGASERNSRHNPYELDVSDKTRYYDASTSWIKPRERKVVTDIRGKAVWAAKYARSKYAKLDSSYKYHGALKGYAYDATGYVLNRAVNDLADIICAIDDGQGMAQPPAKITQRMRKPQYYYPRNGQFICTTAYCYDADGDPMEGVAVTFKWPFKTVIAYTNSDGFAYSWQTIGTYSAMDKQTMKMETVASGVVATDTTYYVPSPILASGTTGVKTTVSTTSPKRYTTVKAKTRFVSKAGKPVVGLPVTFTWYFKGKTVTMKAVTDKYGYARCERNIGGATKGYRVYVKGKAYSGGYCRYSRASFVPR